LLVGTKPPGAGPLFDQDERHDDQQGAQHGRYGIGKRLCYSELAGKTKNKGIDSYKNSDE
jgi:hypothetical protein